MKKTPLKRTSKPLTNNKGIKRGSGIKRKVKTEEEKQQQKEDIERMWVMFLEIWEERPHRSEVSGAPLGNEPLSWMFDHLLEKGSPKYRHLKYEKRNIKLVTFEEHSLKTAGNPLPKHKEFIEEAKVIFNV